MGKTFSQSDPNIPVELCFRCGEPTKKAGITEDSLYLGQYGPYCEYCYDIALDQAETLDDIQCIEEDENGR